MQELTQHGMARLQQNLIDVIKEAQAKVGYRKEAIRLYYPLRTINHFFDGSYTPEQMEEMLGGLENYTKEALGGVTVTRKDERFCFAIPEEGVTQVHEQMGPNEFIRKLVNLVRTPDCTIEQVRNLFFATSPEVHFEEIPENEEFEYLIYFEDACIDPYYYCFNKEFGILSYHRFLPEDYADVTR